MGIDYIWLNYLSNGLYAKGLKPLLRFTADGKIQAVVWAIILVYVVMAIGVTAFVLPKVQSFASTETFNKALFALLWGALFGFIVYAVYDFTNYGIMTAYPINVAFIDIAWGTILSGIVSMIVAFIFL
jgi:uncharacterized membrane protein